MLLLTFRRGMQGPTEVGGMEGLVEATKDENPELV